MAQTVIINGEPMLIGGELAVMGDSATGPIFVAVSVVSPRAEGDAILPRAAVIAGGTIREQ